jgi:hypothetical protein
VLLGWSVPRLAAWAGVNPALASALVLASPLMLANGVAGLHNDLLMAGLMAAALVVAADHGWAWGAALGGAAAAVKVPGGLVCLGIVLLSLPVAASPGQRVRRSLAVAGVSVGVLLGLSVVSGLGHGWIEGLAVPGAINTPLSLTTVVGGIGDQLALLLGLDTEPATFRDLVRTAGTLVALAVAVGIGLRWRTGERADALGAVGLAVGVLVLASPVVRLWTRHCAGRGSPSPWAAWRSRRSCRSSCSPRAPDSAWLGSRTWPEQRDPVIAGCSGARRTR